MANSRKFSLFGYLLLQAHLTRAMAVRTLLLALTLTLIGTTAQAQSSVTVSLTSPSTQTSFSTNRNAIILRGTASSPVGIQRVTWWVRNVQTEGTAKGAENWEVDNLWLVPGSNELWMTAYDFAGNKTTNIWFITYTPETSAPQIVFTAPVTGQVIPQGTQPKIAWFITGTPPPEWTRNVVVPDVIIDLYRNGAFLTRLSDIASGVTSLNVFAMNYPEGDGYQFRIASYEGFNVTSRYFTFSPVFRIGPGSAPTIPKFTVVAPNGEESNSITAKLGEAINFRWQTGGGLATQQTIDNGVGSVSGRDSKLITTTQIGQFTYTLTASNSAGSASQSVTVNVVSNQSGNIVNTAEVLHNGITLNSVWPPKPADYQDTTQLPPYLVNPPSLIPINTGRQLFVDDFLIESTNLTRQFHPATMHPGNPVLKASSNVEGSGEGPMAMPFSNGVFYDPADRLFKMWYMCGYRVNVCYATSTDGVSWNKPNLDVVPGSNVVFKDTHFVDTYTNWIDLEEPNPARRYKMLRVVYTDPDPLEYHLHYSADGIHWGPAAVINKSLTYDRTSLFFNPFRKKWGLSLKDVQPGPIRLRRYVEHADLSMALSSVVTSNPSSAETLFSGTSKWMKADALDTAHPNDPAFTPNLYAFDAAGYESLMLAQFSILRGSGNKPFGRPKLNEVYFGFSRDGFYWHRPNRQAMFSVGAAGEWNYGNVQPIAGGPLVVGDQMYFYFSGRGGRDALGFGSNDSNGATGLATMRRDGFASLNAGATEGSLTTRRVAFDGQHLFVNAQLNSGGSLCAEVLNDSNQVIAPFTKANCQPFTGNSTKQRLTWTGASDLGSLIGQAVRFRFYVTNGKLFSFWVSPTTDGASRGYIGAGGPGYASYRDTGGVTASNPSVSITPATQSVTIGQNATLSYSISNASSASISPAIAGCNIVLNNGVATGSCSLPTSATGTTNYVLQATGNGQTVSALATVIVTAIADTTSPIATLTAPTQNLFPAGTTQVNVALTTNENATCRMATTDVPFASMQLLTQTGALAHGFTAITADGQSYNYLLRCADAAGNLSTTQFVNFAVASPIINNNGNKALQFDGRSGTVSVASSVAIPATKQWTMESWIKTTAQPADFQTILGNASGNDLRLSPGANARATVSIYTGSFTNFIGSKKINDGQWHHVIAVRNNDKLYLYVDGQPDTDSDSRLTAKPINSPTGNSQLTLRAIGNRGTASEWYEGQVDEVRLFNRAFSSSEVTARYNNGSGQPVANEAGLHLGFSLDESSGPAIDVTASMHRGTLSGGVTRVASTRGGGGTVVQNPAITSFTASASTITVGQSVTLSWATANVTSATISGTNCTISNPATGSCVHTPTTTGQFTLTFSATGNGQTVTRALTLSVVNTVVNPIDTQKPTVTIAPMQTALINAPTIRLTGSAQDNVGVTAVSFQTDRNLQGNAAGTTSWSADVQLVAGSNLITVRALDAAGNTGTATINVTYDPNTTDKTPPVVTVVIPQANFYSLGTRQVAVEIATNESCTCRIATDPDTLFEAMTPFAQLGGTTGGLTHRLTIATQDGQLYPRMVRCIDAANNISNPAYFNFRVGGSDRALSLDGTTGYVEVPLDPGVSALNWTLETWINTNATFGDFATVVGNRSGSDLRLTNGTNATVVVSTFNGQFTNMFGKRKVNDGQWHHIVGIREGDKLRIYVDGQLDSDRNDAFNTGFVPMGLPATPTTFSAKAVGNRGTLSETYRGLLDNVRAYNRALTLAEVQAHFSAGHRIVTCGENGLLVGYDFNEDGALTGDISGNGRSGILRGTAARVSK